MEEKKNNDVRFDFSQQHIIRVARQGGGGGCITRKKVDKLSRTETKDRTQNFKHDIFR